MKQSWRTVGGAVVVAGVLFTAGRTGAQASEQGQPRTPAAEKSQPAEQRQGRGQRPPDKLKVGDLAPDFTLKSLDGPRKVTLSDFRGKRPVVLIFGSYT